LTHIYITCFCKTRYIAHNNLFILSLSKKCFFIIYLITFSKLLSRY